MRERETTTVQDFAGQWSRVLGREPSTLLEKTSAIASARNVRQVLGAPFEDRSGFRSTNESARRESQPANADVVVGADTLEDDIFPPVQRQDVRFQSLRR